MESKCLELKLYQTASKKKTAADRINGYELLEKGTTFRLAMTTFADLSSTTLRCVTAKTTEKDDSRLEVTEEVQYQMQPGNLWHSFRQNFQFKCGSEGYDIMTSVGNSTVPPAGYRFLWAETNCTVITYLKVDVTKGEEPQPEARNSEADGAQQQQDKHDCMLWVKGASNEPSDACKTHFNQLCHQPTRQSFSTTECTPPTPESKQGTKAAENLELLTGEDMSATDN
uniref:Uncharacterized protein n=1 Tax=Amblyomma maculatum TaxID=34609 RepID=G3MPK3_AMBMU